MMVNDGNGDTEISNDDSDDSGKSKTESTMIAM